jgi:hypothetical protein
VDDGTIVEMGTWDKAEDSSEFLPSTSVFSLIPVCPACLHLPLRCTESPLTCLLSGLLVSALSPFSLPTLACTIM